MIIDKEKVSRILHMYQSSAIYISKAEIDFPTLKAHLQFPETPMYLVRGLGIRHINNTEVELITNQALFLFYRQALLEGALKFPIKSEEELQKYYDAMFIKKEIDYYERFTDRNRKDLVLTLEHENARKIGSAFLVWCNLSISGFLKAKVIGGVEIEI